MNLEPNFGQIDSILKRTLQNLKNDDEKNGYGLSNVGLNYGAFFNWTKKITKLVPVP
jgi:hypothetical protein